jgi:hypothetical protein
VCWASGSINAIYNPLRLATETEDFNTDASDS